MFKLTLVENRSTPPVFAVHVTHEKARNGSVERVERRYANRGGKWSATGTRLVPYTRNKAWEGLHTGEKGSHKRPFSAKRDWLILRGFLRPATPDSVEQMRLASIPVTPNTMPADLEDNDVG